MQSLSQIFFFIFINSKNRANDEYEKLEFENKKQKKMIEKMKEVIENVIANEENNQNGVKSEIHKSDRIDEEIEVINHEEEE